MNFFRLDGCYGFDFEIHQADQRFYRVGGIVKVLQFWRRARIHVESNPDTSIGGQCARKEEWIRAGSWFGFERSYPYVVN